MANQFSLLTPNILQNSKIREPQIESYKNILSHFSKPSFEREVGIVLPVGCGKSGAIGLTPFALKAKRANAAAAIKNLAFIRDRVMLLEIELPQATQF